MTTTTEQSVDERLQEKSLLQFAFKGDTVRAVAVAVARAFDASSSGSVWSDEVELPPLEPDDRNIIGMVWRGMAKWGIVRRMEGATDHRRSRNKSRRGGVAWRYEIVSRGLLRTFMLRNHTTPAGDPQGEFQL